jgi:hypothetical protein
MAETAFDIARRSLLAHNLTSIVKNTGAVVLDEHSVTVAYFDRILTITLPDCDFMPSLPDFEKTLVLHYLAGGGREPAEANRFSMGDYVSYANLKDGMFYFKTFQRRGPERIRKAFSENAGFLIDSARMCGGTIESYPDVSVRVPVFPNLRIIIILTRGDDEFPSSVNMLFPPDATSYLPLEDIALMGDILAKKLCTNKGLING